MINYKKYWRSGWGLESSQLKELENLIIDKNIKTIVEFGSGGSTEFLNDIKNLHNLHFSIISFDHDKKYAYNHPDVKIRNLISCSDDTFEEIFNSKKINIKLFSNVINTSNTRTKNCFYNIQENDIPCNIDLVILDGPNGNGRSLSFVHLLGKLNHPCYIMIDDVNHYDFLDRAKQIFEYDVITYIQDKQIHPLFSYALIKT